MHLQIKSGPGIPATSSYALSNMVHDITVCKPPWNYSQNTKVGSVHRKYHLLDDLYWVLNWQQYQLHFH